MRYCLARDTTTSIKGGATFAEVYDNLAPQPERAVAADPTEAKQLDERTFAFIDEALKSGRILEVGWFADGTSGYSISTGEDAKGVLTGAFSIHPWAQYEVHEIIDYETGKEIDRQVLKAQAEQMAAMKR